MSTLTHHPLRALGGELHHLHDLEQEGESAATPLLAMLTIAAVVFPLLFAVIGIAYLVAYLVTGAFL